MKNRIIKNIIPLGVAGAMMVGQSIPILAQTMEMTTMESPSAMSEETQEYPFDYYVNDDGTGIEIGRLSENYSGELVIPSTIDGLPVTSIGDKAFRACTKLISITIPNSVTHIGESAFNSCRNLKNVTMPDGITSIEVATFSECESLESITIPDGVTSIDRWTFWGCSSLQKVIIPDSVTYMANDVFSHCTSLVNLVVSENNQHYLSENGVLYNKDKTELITYLGGKKDATFTIPDSVLNIKGYAFYECAYLESITIPDNANVESWAFCECDKLDELLISENNKNYLVENGVLYNKDKTKIYRYLEAKKDTYFEIPKSVKAINEGAFACCSNLESVTIPDDVTIIGGWAFSGCTSLKSITMPDDVIDIGDWAFNNCQNIEEIVIPNGITSIGQYTFSNCISLKNIVIPDGVTDISPFVFQNCNSLESIIIPDSVTDIEWGAFNKCDNLTIYGYEGSYAQTYAKENDINFEVIKSVPTPEPSEPIIGDVDEDAMITGNDASLLARYLTSNEDGIITEQGMISSDVNHDGNITMEDLVKLKKYLVDTQIEL